MSLGDRIVRLRERKSWSQRELASRANINVSVLNRIEKGERPARADEILTISRLLDVSTDYLLKGEEKPDYREKAKEILDDPNALIAGRDGNIDAETMLKAIEEILKKRNKE
ncbi:helix-turn-helix domain-containing protein [Alkalicoccus luteus]|uniref:Helix-turn-helix transcriptional regulator n=1 Tax=Alkalicoccus luteus TaxID=1237094 RepID=A0A969PQV5_9BACI|nr:helix-turn-helix transcriptional regulator [Alkalicoccus luteus]NJP37890.1 helix-turn-helix transcriptional regulator [Alkalicoccus luteus]